MTFVHKTGEILSWIYYGKGKQANHRACKRWLPMRQMDAKPQQTACSANKLFPLVVGQDP